MNGKTLIAASIVLLIGAESYANEMETQVATEFKNYMEMAQSEAFQQGLIPSYLPQSASNIQLLHNPETNNASIIFDFQPEDTSSIKGNCVVSDETEQTTFYVCDNKAANISIELSNEGKGVYMIQPISDG